MESAPQPHRARTLEDFITALRSLKIWYGNPSISQITQRVQDTWRAAGRPANEWPSRATVGRCFTPSRQRVDEDLVIAVVAAVVGDQPQVIAVWQQALRRVLGLAEVSNVVTVYDRLPADLAGFTGRNTELNRLREAMHHAQRDGAAVVVSAIEGMAGIGKTRLAVHAGHLLNRDRPFDRVLFVNLRGFHPDQPPVDPAAVLDGFLRLLGMPGQQIPHRLDARTAAYRDRLAGSRSLVVLDNAADTDQIRPLLPATAGCLTLITSRRGLTDLPSATHLAVDVFTPGEAVDFLTRAVGETAVGADPHAAARIAERCGCLPLALSLVAAHIRGMSGWTLTDHADRLDERHNDRRLDAGIEHALALSYKHLRGDRQRLLRLAALHPGQDFDAHAAAALTDVPLPTADADLQDLCRDHLLQQAASGRFSFHDLVRDYATGRAADQDPPPQRRAALARLFDFYLATATTAMDLAYPHERRHRPAIPLVGIQSPVLPDRDRAELWLDTELANLLAAARHAAAHGWPQYTWQLSAVLDRHLLTRGRFRDAETLHQHALVLARHLHDQAAEMRALNSLGYIDRRLGRHEQAGDNHGRALRIAQAIADPIGELTALNGLGYAHWMVGRYEHAGDDHEQALKIAQAIGDPVGELNALNGLGYVHWLLAHYERAGHHYEEALPIARAIGDRVGARAALNGLGHVHRMLGRHNDAVHSYQQALQIAEAIGDRVGARAALSGLGHAHRALGRHSDAVRCYQQVLDLAREIGDGNWQFEALQGLGRLHHAAGRPELALIHHEQALRFAIDLAQPSDQARAHDGLAHAYHALDDHDRARRHWEHALDILTSLGTDQTEEPETSTAAICGHLTDLARPQPPGAPGPST